MPAALHMSALMAKAVGAGLGLILGTALLCLSMDSPPVLPPPQSKTSTVPTTASSDPPLTIVLPPSLPPVRAKPLDTRKPSLQEQGMLSVNVIPGDVRVYIDGRRWRRSIPFQILLPAGQHQITIEEPGAPASARIRRDIVITAGGHCEIVERM